MIMVEEETWNQSYSQNLLSKFLAKETLEKILESIHNQWLGEDALSAAGYEQIYVRLEDIASHADNGPFVLEAAQLGSGVWAIQLCKNFEVKLIKLKEKKKKFICSVVREMRTWHDEVHENEIDKHFSVEHVSIHSFHTIRSIG
jgi:hypothetical protein